MKKKLLFLTLIIMCFIVILLLPKQNNDITIIIKDALFEDNKENDQIEIFEINDVLKYKIIGFTYDNNSRCGYAVIQVLDHSRYKLISLKKSEEIKNRAHNIFNDVVYLWDDKTNTLISYFVILNLNDNLSKIKFNFNLSEDIIENQYTPSMILIKLPREYTGEYLFFDKLGNPIK